MILAKATRQEVQLPVNLERPAILLARGEQKKLAALHHNVAKIADDAFLAKAKLYPFDYGAERDRRPHAAARIARRAQINAAGKTVAGDEKLDSGPRRIGAARRSFPARRCRFTPNWYETELGG